MLACLRSFTVLGLVGLLTACGTTSSPELDPLPLTPGASIEQQLQQAAQSKPAHAAQLRFNAAEQAIRQGQTAQAQSIFNQLDINLLPASLQLRARVQLAELALSQNAPQQALSALPLTDLEALAQSPLELQRRAHLARANALAATGQTLAAVRERVYVGTFLTGAEHQENNEHLWALVNELPDSQLKPTGDSELDGWLQLGLLTRQGALPQQQSALRDWLNRHPQHSAALDTPLALEQLLNLRSQQAANIALLLPQSGPLASVARALRDGFIAAQMQDESAGASIKMYDSNQIGSLASFYAKAKKDGIDLVVGPLEKPMVKQLADFASLSIPTLALNYADAEQQAPRELVQFGLAAEDEAREAARRAWADGHTQAVAMVPKGEWGDRVLAAFAEHFSSLGGTLRDSQRIDQPVQLAQQIATLFQLRAQGPQKSLTSSSASQAPERRDDVDFLFLAATPEQAQQVKPTLAFQYLADVPVYATSHLFTGALTPAQLKDLDGIRFCETPWLLAPHDPLQQQIGNQWPQANTSLGRLYAMGIDAYHLSQRLSQLQLAGQALEGYTGILRLGHQQRIERELPWAEIRNGQIQRLAEPL